MGMDVLMHTFLKTQSDANQMVLVINMTPEQQAFYCDQLTLDSVQPTPRIMWVSSLLTLLPCKHAPHACTTGTRTSGACASVFASTGRLFFPCTSSSTRPCIQCTIGITRSFAWCFCLVEGLLK